MELTDKKISFVHMIPRNKNIFILVFFFFLLIQKIAWAQPRHFVYFQHERSQPFYVKYEEQIFRSSSTGYLILSKLVRGRQQIELGVDSSHQQLLIFCWDSLSKDKGYLVKNFGDSGWVLYDLQLSEIIYPKSKIDPAGQTKGNKSLKESGLDAFGNMLAQVTRDSSVKYVVNERPENKTTGLRSVIIELNKNESQKSKEIKFLVREKKITDTVNVIFDNFLLHDTVKKTHPLDQVPSIVKLPDFAIENSSRILADSGPSGEDSVQLIKSEDSIIIHQDSSNALNVMNPGQSNCLKTADEDQFVKLRMRMAGQYTEEKMIEEAVGFFKQVCFTTTQLRRLSLLMAKDEMKYKFFASAIGYISDANQFPALRNELQEEINRLRFDALITNP